MHLEQFHSEPSICSIPLLFFDANAVTITTKIGPMIGTQVDTNFFGENGKVNMFRGIPYAEPPTGNLRFRKPVPKRTYPNPVNARFWTQLPANL